MARKSTESETIFCGAVNSIIFSGRVHFIRPVIVGRRFGRPRILDTRHEIFVDRRTYSFVQVKLWSKYIKRHVINSATPIEEYSVQRAETWASKISDRHVLFDPIASIRIGNRAEFYFVATGNAREIELNLNYLARGATHKPDKLPN